MAKNTVKPFKGLYYNPEKIPDLDKVVAPPYDIITSSDQNELYRKSQYNLVRLTLGKDIPGDHFNSNKYTRAREDLERFRREKIFIQADKPAIYPYRAEYEADGQKKTLNSFFALLKLDPEYRYVKAHESTLARPKEDRLNLLRSVRTNLEPIEVLYRGKACIHKLLDAAQKPARYFASAHGEDGSIHSIWKLESSRAVEKICKELEEETFFIADGHHRYQTAVDYLNERLSANPDLPEETPERYRLALFVDISDPGLSILPTHRCLKGIKNFSPELFLKKIEEHFRVEEKSLHGTADQKASQIEKALSKGREARKNREAGKNRENGKIFAFYPGGERAFMLKLKTISSMDKAEPGHSSAWKKLDVSILHSLLLRNGFGITQENLESHITYTKSALEALKLVDQKRAQACFLINPTKLEELEQVILSGETMPQKSTYFLPKILSGLVMYPFE
jgi:uncharacterized protein (DUF1015 family)